MPNAIDMYRAQQTAANEVYAKLSEVAALVQRIRVEVNTLAQDHRVHEVLRQEQTWLEQAERTVKEVQRWRELEAYRFWPRVVYRWGLALAFSLLAIWSAAAGYGWTNSQQDRQIADLRLRLKRLDTIEQRVDSMTPAEHRQFDALLTPPDRPHAGQIRQPRLR
jgi:hypothetical protein